MIQLLQIMIAAGVIAPRRALGSHPGATAPRLVWQPLTPRSRVLIWLALILCTAGFNGSKYAYTMYVHSNWLDCWLRKSEKKFGSQSWWSDWRLWIEFKHEFVTLWINNLLSDVEMRQLWNSAEQWDISLPEQECQSWFKWACDQNIAHQTPWFKRRIAFRVWL